MNRIAEHLAGLQQCWNNARINYYRKIYDQLTKIKEMSTHHKFSIELELIENPGKGVQWLATIIDENARLQRLVAGPTFQPDDDRGPTVLLMADLIRSTLLNHVNGVRPFKLTQEDIHP